MLEKKTDEAFGKKVYLLGKDGDGVWYWLEEAKWGCNWYWGFGYVENYTRNEKPGMSKDITAHQHYDSLLFKKNEESNYMHKLSDIKGFESVLTENEEWELSDLMKSFYTLSKTAEIYHKGHSHLASSIKVSLKNKRAYERINKKELPEIFKRVYEILQ